MSIERLTKAVRAAGYAMALNDTGSQEDFGDTAAQPVLMPPVVGAALMVTPVRIEGATSQLGWSSPWKLWASTAAPRFGT